MKKEMGDGYRCVRFGCGNPVGRNPPDAVSQKVASSLQSCGYESDQQSIRTSLARLRNRYSCRPEVRPGVSDARERFSSTERIPNRTHVWERKRVGQERTGGWGLRARGSRRAV